MTYPKMLYRSDTQFPDEEALKAGLAPGGAVKKMVVESEQAEGDAVDAGWTDAPLDFIGAATEAPKRGRKAKAEEPAA